MTNISNNDLVNAKNDIVFKKIFADDTAVLKVLISDILDIPLNTIEDIRVLNPELPPDWVNGKLSRLDILMKTSDRNINIEMQVGNKKFFSERILYYRSKMYSGDPEQGENYGKLKQSISVSILGFDMFDCKEYHSAFSIRENTRNEILNDKLAIHFFELNKIPHNVDEHNRKQLWLQFINAHTKEEFDMLSNTNVQEIRTCVDKIYTMSSDEKFREELRQREKAEFDYNTDIYCAKAEGRAEGRAEGEISGKAKERENTIARLKRMGLSDADIQKFYET